MFLASIAFVTLAVNAVIDFLSSLSVLQNVERWRQEYLSNKNEPQSR